jgi:hypothetical protein
MIWTVILKNGDNFVVHGSSFDRNTEVRKCLKGRSLRDEAVAGIVQGNHHVEPYNSAGPIQRTKDYSEQFRSALAVPEMSEHFPEEELYPDDLPSSDSKTDLSPVNEQGRPFNDPAEW